MSLSRWLAPLCAAFLGFVSAASADPLDRIHDDDREALEAFALYPEEVRDHALEVATEPGALVALQDLQDESQQTFRDLLDPYPQSDQEQLFELSRYPDLVEEIARGGPKGRGELERIASGYPEEVREAVLRQGGERHRVVSRMHALLEDFDRRFGGLIEDLPPAKQRGFRRLLGTPELLSLMSEHTQMTVLLGDAFERDPQDVRDALAALNLEVARRNAEEADDWKRTVDADPELRRDYDAAASDYRRETGYDPYQPVNRTVVQVHVNPYPYWFGYPWWYPVSYTYYDPWYWWYPRRTWAHCGYHYGPRVAFYGGGFWRPFYPSWHFTSWYFSFGHHHHRYPYLSDRFYSYYQRPVVIHNHHYNVHKRVVKKFVWESHRVLPGQWSGKRRGERIARFRDYGRIAPQIEPVRGKQRYQEIARSRGKSGPGSDFTLRDRGGDDRVTREEARKLVAKNPKRFPELAKLKKEDWDRPRERDRADAVDRGKRGDAPDLGREAGGKRDGGPALGREPGKRDSGPALGREPGGKRDAGPSSAQPRGDAERDRSARPAAQPDGGKGRAKQPPEAGSGGKRGDAGSSSKARPSFERPGGERPGSGSGSRERGAERQGSSRERAADRPGSGSPDAGASPRRGGDGGEPAIERRGNGSREPGARRGSDPSPPSSGKRSGSQRSGGDDAKPSTRQKAAPSFDAPSSSRRERAQPPVERRSESRAQPQVQRRSEPRKAPTSVAAPRRERRPDAPKQVAPRRQETRSAPRARAPEPRAEAPRVQRESRGGSGGGGGNGGRRDGGGKGGKKDGDGGNGGGGKRGR